MYVDVRMYIKLFIRYLLHLHLTLLRLRCCRLHLHYSICMVSRCGALRSSYLFTQRL